MNKKVVFLGLFLVLCSFNSKGQNEMLIDDVFVTTSGGVIVLNNTRMTNEGTVRDSFALWHITGTGDTAQSAIGGDSLTVINDIEITKSNTTPVVGLQGDFTILGDIRLTDGQIYLDSNDIELGTNGNIVFEDDDNHIFDLGPGTIFKDTSLNGPTAVNTANMGIEITSTSNIGAIRITRGHNRLYSWDSTGYSIQRWFDFDPANNNGLNATIRFYYLGVEQSPFTDSELDMWLLQDTLWFPENVPYNATHRDYSSPDSAWLLTTGIDSLVRVTLGSSNRLYLPVEWLNVGAKWTVPASASSVFWSTASEENTDYFEVERSYNGKDFEAIGRVEAAGNSNFTMEYEFKDNNVNNSRFRNIVYYRLRQADFNGSFSHSEIMPLTHEGNKVGFLVYPNPARNVVNLKIFGSRTDFTVQVIDQQGRQVDELVMNGMSNSSLNFSEYAQGSYYIKFIDKNNRLIEVVKVQKVD